MNITITDKLTQRFWSKVDIKDKDQCWEWKAGKNRGYGVFRVGKLRVDRQMIVSNRMSWILTYGYIPDGLNVCHKCDNPSCCNPHHLFLGTDGDNLRDMVRKGRHWMQSHGEEFIGAKNPNAHLTEIDVINILRDFCPRKITAKMLANKYNTTESYINRIIGGYVWKRVDRSEVKRYAKQ